MSKLTKKKKILISVLTVVGAILIVAAILVGLIFRPAHIIEHEDLGFETVCYNLPDDGNPTAHTGIENIGYMNWRLQNQPYWYSEAHVKVDNSMDDQNVSTYKQYNNGVLISTDISNSNLVNKAVQYCQVKGGDVVLFRNSKGGKSTFDAINTPWKTDKPDGHTIAEYKVKKGLPPLEFSVYILNENTVKECSDVIDNGNGTYTQTFVLNFDSEPVENDAAYWYKTEMVYKANGMMKDYPQFSELSITYTFDDTWQVLSSKTREVYKTITGLGAVSCVAEGITEYTYGNKELCYNPEFENYYKDYMADYETPEDSVIDAAVCLSEAFADFMQGEVKLALDLTVDDSEYSGVLQLNIPENDIRVDLGNIKVYMLAEGEEQYLYISYGDNVKAKIALSDLTSDQPATAAESEDTSDILDKLLEALGDEENFTLAEDKRSATLSPSIDLGELLGIDLDITLDLNFKFNISEQKVITLDYVEADGNILGADFAAELRFSDKGVEALTKAEAAEYTAIDINGIASLALAEALKLELAYSGNGAEIEGGVTINLNDLKVKADLQVALDGNADAAKNLSIAYADDYVYITLGSEGSQPAMLKASASEAAEIIGELLGDIGAEAEEIDILQTVLSILQEIGTGNVLNFLLADDGLSSMLALSGTDTAVITVDGAALLNKLGVEFELGEITAELGDGKIGLSAFGLDVTVTGTEAFTLNTDEYQDAADIMPVVKKLINVISDKKLSVSGDIYLNINGTQVELDIELISVDWSDGLKIDIVAYVKAGDIAEDLRISYGDGAAKASVGNLGIVLADGDLNDIVNAVLEILGQTEEPEVKAGGLGDMFALLGDADIFAIINSLEISGSDSSLITLSIGDFEIVLFDQTNEENGILGISAAYVGEGIEVSLNNVCVTEYVTPDEPEYEIEYFDGKYIIPVIESVAEYIKENGLSVSGSLEIGGVNLSIETLAISWVDGIEVKAHINIVYAESEEKAFNKNIYFEYSADRAALYIDNVAIVLSGEDYNSFAEAVKALYEVISADTDGSVDPDISFGEELIAAIAEAEEESGSDIFAILASIGFAKNENGNLEISYGGLTAELVAKDSVLGANVTYDAGEGSDPIKASIAVGAYETVIMPTGCEEISAAELINLLNDVTEIIANKGLTVSGAISLDLGTSNAKLTVYGLSVGWENGIALQLDARIEAGESVHDFYAEYNQSTGQLKLVYGAIDGGVGININITEDADKLEDALMAIYDRIAGLVNGAVEGEIILPEVGSLDGLLELIKSAIDTAGDVAELAETVEENGINISIVDILNSIDYTDGNLTVDIMGITLTLSRGEDGFYLVLQTDSVALELADVKLVKTYADDFGIEVENALDADDIADLLDYIAATVELFVKDTFNITLQGTVTSTEEAYAETDGVKYNINAGFEYVQGESGFPIHFVPETVDEDGQTITPPDFWIAPDMYVHLYVNMISTIDDVDSVLFDIYIFDGNPATNNGKAAYTYNPEYDGDNELDIYMSISRVPKDGTALTHEPLKIYAPMNEIMTVLSAGLALVDVGSVTIDAIPELNGIIAQIGEILDTLLVNRYLADTKDQFTSLGTGLLESILGGSISDLLNDLIGGLTGNTEPSEGASEGIAVAAIGAEDGGFKRERHGVIEVFDVTRDGDGKSELTLAVGQTTTTVTKQNGSLSALNINTVELNDTDTLNDFNIAISYDGVEKVTSLEGYTSFVGADSLIKAIINSATHAETAEDGSNTYALNNNFFIDGTISLSALNIFSINVTIDGLSVIIDEQGEVGVNLRMHYPGFILAIAGDTSVDLTVKDGMVYIKRVQTATPGLLGSNAITPITIYRAMPVDIFMDDILEQMIFMFNFESLVANLIRGSGSDDNPSEKPEIKEDYGTQLGKYFNWFTFAENASAGTAQWQAQISGTGLSELAGITLDDITATFNAVKDTTDGHVITGLGISGALFGAISFTANLNWQNPQENWRSDSAKATFEELAENNPSVTAGEWLGGTAFEQIENVTKWDNLLEAIGQKHFEITFVGGNDNVLDDNITSTLKLRRQDYYYRTSIYGSEEEYITSVYVLYLGGTEFTVYSEPDLNDYAIPHCSADWNVQTIGNVQKHTVVYIPNTYMVYFTSEHEYPDFGREWSYGHSYGTILSFNFLAELRGGKDDIWYRVDYLLINGKQYTAENIHELEITEETYVDVIWKEIPHATVTVVSDNYIEGFEEVDGKYVKDFEIETGADVNLADTVGEIADFGDYVYGGFTLAEGAEETSDIVNIEGDTTVYVKWISPEIRVVYYSTLAMSVEGEEVYSYSADYNAVTSFAVDTPAIEGYHFLGWYYNDPTNGWMPVSNVKTDVPGSDKYSIPVELHALWYTYSMSEFTVSHRSEGGFFGIGATHYYDFSEITVTSALFGNSNLLRQISYSNVTIYTIAKANQTYEANVSGTHPYSDGESWRDNFTQTVNLNEEQNMLQMVATFDPAEYNPGASRNYAVAVAEFAVSINGYTIIEHKQNSNEIMRSIRT